MGTFIGYQKVLPVLALQYAVFISFLQVKLK